MTTQTRKLKIKKENYFKMPMVLAKPLKLGICKVQAFNDGRNEPSWASIFLVSEHREKLEKPMKREVSKETL